MISSHPETFPLFNLRRAEVTFVLILVGIVALVTLFVRAQPPPVASLKSVHFATEQYIGKRVQLTGTVRVFQDTGAPYYVLEDDQENRVLLRSNPRQLAAYANRTLTVVGTVGFDDHTGIFLTVEKLSASP
ncbi:MAG: hypothetical protein ACRDIY_01275 [Chloroflexota bacterium]